MNAAASGDILLLRTGVYNPIAITGKSRTLAAAPDAVVTLGRANKFNGTILTTEAPFSIGSIDAQQSVVIRGIRLAQLRAANCAGTLLFDPCVGVGCPAGMEITNCAAVAFEGCVLDGDALNTPQTIFVPGSPGIRLGGGKLMLSASIGKGGKGQDGVCPSEGPGILPAGVGGPGINITDPSSAAFAYASLLEGGPGGLGGCTAPISGPAVAGLTGLYTALPGTSTFDFLVNSPVHEQQSATFLLKSAKGDVPLFLVSALPAAAITLTFHGARIAGVPRRGNRGRAPRRADRLLLLRGPLRAG